MIIYQIKLPKKQDAEAFVKFMQEEYFPSVSKVGPTRVGQVFDLMLLERENETEGDHLHQIRSTGGFTAGGSTQARCTRQRRVDPDPFAVMP